MLLLGCRPKVLFVQNPSVVLTFLACLLKPLFGYRLVVDAHNAGVAPEGLFSKFVYFLCKYAHRKADITIVTNSGLARIIEQNSGRPLILQDRIPQLNTSSCLVHLSGKLNVVYICTFEADEPFSEVVTAAGMLDSSISLYVTGNLKKCPPAIIQKAASNIHFTDFLPDEQYLTLLRSANCLMDLTKREDCLVCGAYEAVAVEKPVILSDTKALRSYFYKGVIYTDHSVPAIVEAILNCIRKEDELRASIIELKAELEQSWLKKAHLVNQILYDIL
jgi:glycosyltransferase involved in cell wall biosynthesis